MFSVSYSSHNGYYSIWHAMTYNPKRSLKETTEEIIDHIVAMCKLALFDETLDDPAPNSFWLGFALHTIMDAYSPAHLLRVGTKTGSPKCEVMTPKEGKEILVVNKMKEKVREMSFKSCTEDDIENITNSISEEYEIKSLSAKKDIKELARFFLFHNQEMNSISQIRSIVAKTMVKKVLSDPLEDKIFLEKKDIKPIKLYYFYPSQSSYFHKVNDLISHVKENGLYDQCVLDVYSILKLYKEALALISEAESRVDKLTVVYAFLRKVYKYMYEVTFVIKP